MFQLHPHSQGRILRQKESLPHRNATLAGAGLMGASAELVKEMYQILGDL
jgi:hypothetical protein